MKVQYFPHQIFRNMNITYNELRDIKHSLPTGSISRIAKTLQLDEQTVRNYFGASDYSSGGIAGKHYQQGPSGGVVTLEDTKIFDLAKQIIKESSN